MRYNPSLSFTTAGSYQSYDTGLVGNGGYTTAFEFDGRYLYILSIAGTVTAYDTSLSFTNASSYCTFSIIALNANYTHYYIRSHRGSLR